MESLIVFALVVLVVLAIIIGLGALFGGGSAGFLLVSLL